MKIDILGASGKSGCFLTREALRRRNVTADAFKAQPGEEEQHLTSMEHMIRLFGQLPDVR